VRGDDRSYGFSQLTPHSWLAKPVTADGVQASRSVPIEASDVPLCTLRAPARLKE
jgi:hypothetical protein